MNRRRVTNFHRVISLFVRLLFFGYRGCYLSIFLAFYRTPLEQRDEQVSWLLLILQRSLIFFPVKCCAFVVDEFLFVVFDAGTDCLACTFCRSFILWLNDFILFFGN